MPFQVQDRCKKTSIRFLYSTSERLRRRSQNKMLMQSAVENLEFLKVKVSDDNATLSLKFHKKFKQR
jgi:CYTH domain-containing protein